MRLILFGGFSFGKKCGKNGKTAVFLGAWLWLDSGNNVNVFSK